MKEIDKEKRILIEERISSILLSYPPSLLKSAIEDALFPGGKRLRPILCLLSCEAVSESFLEALDVAVALEFIHTYSLVHDDIMDLDEERRGKPSIYKKYGVPLAILVGDGLLTLAFEILSSYPVISKEVAKAIGIDGMVLGQAEDIEMQKAKCKKSIDDINLNKTARLFSVSCIAGGIIGGGNKDEISKLNEFGINFGLCFQLKDDMLDNRISKEDYKTKISLFLPKLESSLSIFKEKMAVFQNILTLTFLFSKGYNLKNGKEKERGVTL